MDNLVAVRKRVSVDDGNEAVGALYRKFVFFPRLTMPEKKQILTDNSNLLSICLFI
jgi:hypothetical protein